MGPTLSRRRARRAGIVASSIVLCASTFGAPQITRQPADVVVSAGQNATLTVIGSGSGTLSYQWRRNGASLLNATADTLVLPDASRGSAGLYDVVVSDNTGSTTSKSARLGVAPQSYPTKITTDSAWDLRLEAAETVRVRVIVPAPDGGFYVGGEIASIGGVRRTLIARLYSDGTVDGTFAPPIISGDYVNSITRLPDGHLLVSGQFSLVGRYLRRNLVRLNSDGSVDPSFNSQLPDVAQVPACVVQPDGHVVVALFLSNSLAARLNPDGSIDRILLSGAGSATAAGVQSDGKVVIAYSLASGAFDVARFLSDGTPDTSFQTGGSVPVRPSAFAFDSAGNIYVGGDPGNGTVSLVRLRPDGSRDTSYAPQFGLSTFNGGINKLWMQSDGRLLVAGYFDRINATTVHSVARLNADGSVAPFYAIDPNSSGSAVAQMPDGGVLLGIDANSNNSFAPIRTGLVHYNADATLDVGFNAQMRGPGHTTSLLALANGQYLIFGNFDHAAGLATKRIVRMNADGTPDASFHPGQAIEAYYGTVNGAAEMADGHIAIVGTFTAVGSTSRPGVAILNADGTLDTSFNPVQLFTTANAVGLLPGNRIVVAGSNNVGAYGVAAFQRNGNADLTFGAHFGFDNTPLRIGVQADGSVLVAGFFNKFGAQTANGVVRFDADGTFQSPLNGITASNPAEDLAIGADGKVIVAMPVTLPTGRFTNILRLNADDTIDTSFVDSISEPTQSVIVQEDGKVVVRGALDGSSDRQHLYRLNADGSQDTTFQPVLVPGMATTGGLHQLLLMRDNGQLLTSDGGWAWGQFYGTRPGTAPTIAANPIGTTVIQPAGSATLTVTAQSVVPETYQWQLNGAILPGATNAAYTVQNFSPTAAGDYTVVVANDFGSVTSGTAKVAAPPLTSGHLINLSIRAVAGGDSGHLIVGYTLGGAGTGGTKPMLLRGVGPTLTVFNIAGTMDDPMMELYNSASVKIDQNDDWTGVFAFGSVGAFPFSGPSPKDAAIYNPFAAAGGASFHVFGKNNAKGMVLGEAYDATPSDAFTVFTPRLINGSARSNVGDGDDTLILGFVVAGDSAERVLIRAVGPTLAAAPYNIGGTIADPKLEIYDANSTKIAENDNWGDAGAAPGLTAVFGTVNAFPLLSGSKDAALTITLTPGRYSAVVRGVGTSTGQALVELYELGP